MEEVGKIYRTKEYARFKLIEGNRGINFKSIVRLVNLFSKFGNLMRYFPIVVQEKDGIFYILDGQHRFNTAMQQDEWIYFTIDAENTLNISSIIGCNTAVSKWTAQDYLDAWISLGVESYKELKGFVQKWQIGVTAAVELLTNVGVLQGRELFKKGLFRIENLKFAETVMSNCDDFSKYYSSSRKRYFIRAMGFLVRNPNYDHQRMLYKLERYHNRVALNYESDLNMYMEEFNKLYNFNSSGSGLQPLFKVDHKGRVEVQGRWMEDTHFARYMEKFKDTHGETNG